MKQYIGDSFQVKKNVIHIFSLKKVPENFLIITMIKCYSDINFLPIAIHCQYLKSYKILMNHYFGLFFVLNIQENPKIEENII